MNRATVAAFGLLLGVAMGVPATTFGQTNWGQPSSASGSAPASVKTIAVPASRQSSVHRVQILQGKSTVEIEIEASDRLTPQTQVLTHPDRLVLDFPNAVPGAQLRNQAVNRREVKGVRVGLFGSKPPMTRIVVDLNGPQPYRIFPEGRTVMVKVGGNVEPETAGSAPATRPGLVNTSYPVVPLGVAVSAEPVAQSPLEVSFINGLLSIHANKASLSQVLFAVHQRTGAEIAIPAGAEQEQVVADLGPGPSPEVLAHLLNGSRFDFLIVSSPNDPSTLNRVILSPRGEGVTPPRPQVAQARDDSEPEIPQPPPKAEAPADTPQPPPSSPAPPAARAPQTAQPDPNKPTDDSTPD